MTFRCTECGRERESEALAEACCTMQSPFLPLEVGDFIEIPAWNVTGMVTSVDWDRSGFGTDASISITLQESPDGPEHRYRMEPNEYRLLD